MMRKQYSKFKLSVESNSGLPQIWLSSVYDQSTIFAPSPPTIRFKTWSPAFSCTSDSLLVFTLRSHWLLVIMSHLLIGQRDHFGFGFTAHITNVTLSHNARNTLLNQECIPPPSWQRKNKTTNHVTLQQLHICTSKSSVYDNT